MATVDSAHSGLSGAGVAVLAAAAFVVSVGYGAVLPVLPGWLASLEPSLSASTIANQVGELSGIYMLGVFVGALAAGFLFDWVGGRPVLLAGLVVFLAALLATVHVESVLLLYALRFLAGLAGSAVIPVSAAFIADGSLPASAPRRLAYLGAASLLGFLIGPAIVSLPQLVGADVRWGVSGPAPLLAFSMHATLGLGMLVLVAAFRMRPVASQAPSVLNGGSTTNGATRFPFFALLTLNFSILLGLGGFEVAVALYGNQRLQLDPLRISLMFAECSIVMLLINGVLFLTPLSRFVALRTLLVLSIAAMVGGFILLYRSTAYGSVLAAVALIAAGSGIAMPTVTYSAASRAGRLGAAMGQLTAAGSLGQAMGSFAGGWMFALLSARTFLVGALFMFLALLMAWIGVRGLPAMLGPGEPRALDPVQRRP
jgi:MFS family permease